MRKIKVDAIKRPDDKPDQPYKYRKKYSFHTGDGSILFFGSERSAKAFQAQYNRSLNLIITELNEIYISVFELYRSNWFYLNTGKLTRLIFSIDDLLDRACKNAGSGTPHYAVSAIRGCIKTCEQICSTLLELQAARSNGYEMRKAQTIIARLHYVSERSNQLFSGIILP